MVLVLSALIECDTVGRNGVAVGRIWRHEQQRGAGVCNELRGLRRFVKGRVVHDHKMTTGQAWAQPRLEPGVEDRYISGAFNEERGNQSPLHAGCDQ